MYEILNNPYNILEQYKITINIDEYSPIQYDDLTDIKYNNRLSNIQIDGSKSEWDQVILLSEYLSKNKRNKQNIGNWINVLKKYLFIFRSAAIQKSPYLPQTYTKSFINITNEVISGWITLFFPEQNYSALFDYDLPKPIDDFMRPLLNHTKIVSKFSKKIEYHYVCGWFGVISHKSTITPVYGGVLYTKDFKEAKKMKDIITHTEYCCPFYFL
jgi:hypothetical protein